MHMTMLEPMLRDATIKAIDSVAKKLTDAEATAETKISRLLTHWKEMEPEEKDHAVGIAIATVTTAVTAIIAIRRRAKSPIKAAGKAVAKKVIKKVAKKVT